MRNVKGALVLTGFDKDTAIELVDSDLFIFRAIDGRRSVDEIAGLVAREYELDADTAVTDLQDFLHELAELGVVELVEHG